MTRFAVLGLGEAGATLAADLAAANCDVAGFDPARSSTPDGVVRHDDAAAAVSGAAIVLAVTPASAARAALDAALGALDSDAIYADLSTGSPVLKRDLAAAAAAGGVGFVDVALMAPVPGSGIATPALAAGPAADAFATTMRAFGMPVDVVGPEAGAAATRKLLRSIMMKGLAQLLIESLAAADAAGVAAETWDQLVAQLSAADEALVRRLVTGTPQHARRRVEELDATIEMLTDLGVDATMSHATATRLRAIAVDPTIVPKAPR